MSRPYLPARRQLAAEEWREMALNLALELERSQIPTRERERLDRIANSKQQSDGRETKHSRYVQVVERLGKVLFLGSERIEFSELLERARDGAFDRECFSH